MKSLLKWTGLVLFATAVGLALAFAYDTAVLQTPVAAAVRPSIQATPYLSAQPWGYGLGMMGRGGRGHGGWGMGPGMMGGYGSPNGTYPGNGAPITLDQAVEAAEQYLATYGNPDLEQTEVMEFTNNFYAEVKEQSTGIHAFEILIDRYTSIVYPEPGPNMMWNTRYGHMGGMMGGWGRRQAGAMSVTAEQARDIAQQWLDQYLPGILAAQEADAFYGYYTIHVLKDDQVYGMLSVNGYTGEVWYHTWHGDFINMKELEE